MKWMVAASIVLAITSVIVNFVVLPRGGGAPAVPDLAELPPTLDVKETKAAGPVMITRVDGWNDLDEASRQTHVDRMGEIVSESGIGLMMVVDEYGQTAAAWDQRAGTTLIDEPR